MMYTTVMEEVYRWEIKDIPSELSAIPEGNFSAVSQKFSLGVDGVDSSWVLRLRCWKDRGFLGRPDPEGQINLDITLLNSPFGSNQGKKVIDKELFHLRIQKNYNGSVVTIEGSPGSTISFGHGNVKYVWNDLLQSVREFFYFVDDYVHGSMIITLLLKSRSAAVSTDKTLRTTANGDICFKEINKEKLHGMIAKLENDEKNSDVKIISSDGQEFYAYRWILSEASDVFETMFRSNMTEKETGVVKFEDLSGATVKLLLHYIYTQKIGHEWSTPGVVEEFVYAADKYIIEDLKKFFDANLGKVCTLGNAGNLFILAQKTSLMKAVADILAFIKEQCNDPTEFFEILKNTKIN